MWVKTVANPDVMPAFAAFTIADQPVVGLPPGTTVDSFFTGVSVGGAAMLAAMFVLIALTYLVFVRRDGNLSQLIGYALIILWLAIFGPEGTSALRGVAFGTLKLGWAWLTSG